MLPFETHFRSKPELGVLYRYEDQRYAASLNEYDEPCGVGELKIHLRIYPIKKITNCGVWIEDYSDKGRFVNLEKNKKFACVTQNQAMESFIARKERQISILTHQLTQAKEAIQKAKKHDGEINFWFAK